MSVRDVDEDYWAIYVPPRAHSLKRVLATAAPARVALDPARFEVNEREDGVVFTARDGDLGLFYIAARAYPCTELRLRFPTVRELETSDSVRRTNVIIEAYNGALRGPEMRDVGGKLSVFTLTGKSIDALVAARSANPIDLNLYAAVVAVVELFRTRSLPLSPLVAKPTAMHPAFRALLR
jgi:hypothetical protein